MRQRICLPPGLGPSTKILFVEVAKPPRIMLGREALIFQGFPVEPFLKQVADKHIDIHQPARKGKSSKRSTQSRKWLTEGLMTDLAGNAMALPVLLAITQGAVASLLFRPADSAATTEEIDNALAALGVLLGSET